MFRLHNLTIESKIDWLVKNENILDREIVISPWDEYGIKCYNWISQKWGGEKKGPNNCR